MSGINSTNLDIVVAWPRHLDYPLWRQQIRDNRSLFNKIVVVFTNMNAGKDYREFVKEAMAEDEVTFINNHDLVGDMDWRNVAVKRGLAESNSEWIFFTEQDFFWEEGFWDLAIEKSNEFPYIDVSIQGRMHPCCLIIRKDLLNRTSKNFAVIPDIADHFGRIQRDLTGRSHYDMPPHLWKHYGGLSQNMYIAMQGGVVAYFPQEFKEYAKKCLEVKVPMPQAFKELFIGAAK